MDRWEKVSRKETCWINIEKYQKKIRREENKNRKMKGKGYLSSLGAITKENTKSWLRSLRLIRPSTAQWHLHQDSVKIGLWEASVTCTGWMPVGMKTQE